ncbi:BTB POZ domain-containing At3g22104 [Olea europaea subsp. europaea]|uniref:BTB POZ domain-containing At3g22104 n=1 Tax=Olea europaea subsp. europaea TaxID=158383 RepID=A0A8S0SRJ0_OLEEU|nr:BTB POZ domain-containing At3g22104 [Olea europaea subsp. europaea]
MSVCCDLQVDVNGEQVFLVNKQVISYYSGRISKLFSKSNRATRNLKVILHKFPGGAETFELLTRFCYKKGKIHINPISVCNLHCAAHFMEMSKSFSGTQNLIEQTEKLLEGMKFWTWSELLVALKQCQDLLLVAKSSGILEKCLDSLIERLSSCEVSPCPSTSSTDSSEFLSSCDTGNTERMKNSLTWWFEDLGAFDVNLIEMLVKMMISKNFNHSIISRFLFYYQKSRFASATSDEKIKMVEKVVELLYSLDLSTLSYKSLFGILRVALNLNISKCCRNKLESLIGSLLDQATLDNLLIPSSAERTYLYDVDLVLRFLKYFLGKGAFCLPMSRLKKVANLIDLYIAEAAPDPNLKPAKFLALIIALPNSARDSYDRVYHAVDLYLEVHSGLSEEDKMRVCSGINYDKLSSEVANHIAQNIKIPPKLAAEALVSQQCKLKSLLEDTDQPKPVMDSTCSFVERECTRTKNKTHEQIVLYARKLNLSDENKKLKVHLQGVIVNALGAVVLGTPVGLQYVITISRGCFFHFVI